MPEISDSTPSLADRLGPVLDALAAKEPTPGGGAAAAWMGAVGASLGSMVVAFSLGRDEARDPALRDAAKTLGNARALFLELGEEDAAAYEALSAVLKLDKSDRTRAERLPGVVARAVEVPSIVAATALNALRTMQDLAASCNPYLRSDLGVAAGSMEGAARGAAWMVRANLPLVKDRAEADRLRGEVDRWLADAASLRSDVDAACGAGGG